ncbi:glutathione S-transferase family protein [Methylophaga sp.]|uniref:glutathione S-transferase family protein n=1 Tax=Methylophaga sp. TaxID=2024840 RepID=UPI003F69B9FE
MILYNIALSGNCHKVRLMLHFLGIDYETYNLDLGASEQSSKDYLAINPFGQAPVINDNGTAIRDSQAILVYLARKYGGEKWWPDDSHLLAQIMTWLSTTANEIQNGPARLRMYYKFGRPIDFKYATDTNNKVLGLINNHLSDKLWLVGSEPTIADIALYPYLALAHEGHIDMTPYENIQAWKTRFEALPQYLAMPGIFE